MSRFAAYMREEALAFLFAMGCLVPLLLVVVIAFLGMRELIFLIGTALGGSR